MKTYLQAEQAEQAEQAPCEGAVLSADPDNLDGAAAHLTPRAAAASSTSTPSFGEMIRLTASISPGTASSEVATSPDLQYGDTRATWRPQASSRAATSYAGLFWLRTSPTTAQRRG